MGWDGMGATLWATRCRGAPPTATTTADRETDTGPRTANARTHSRARKHKSRMRTHAHDRTHGVRHAPALASLGLAVDGAQLLSQPLELRAHLPLRAEQRLGVLRSDAVH